MKRLTSLFVDSRETGGLRSLLKDKGKDKGIDVVTETLPQGDFAWWCPKGLVLVERKSVTDLESSLSSGRLYEQLTRCAEVAAIPILMIEGKIGEYVYVRRGKGKSRPSQRWSFVQIDHTLLKWQMKGVYIAHSMTNSDTPNRVLRLYEWTQKDTPSSIVPPLLPPPQPRDSRLRTLMTLPGIGAKKGGLLLKSGSLMDILFMPEERLAEWVGKAAAKRVRHYLDTGEKV